MSQCTAPSDAVLERLLVASSQAHRPGAGPHQRLLAAARPSRAQDAAGDPCRRHQRQGLGLRLSARDAGRRRARASMSTRRRIWCAFTNASASPDADHRRRAGGDRWRSASAPTAGSRSPSSRSPLRRRSSRSRAAEPMRSILEVGLGGRLDATNVDRRSGRRHCDHAGGARPSGIPRRHDSAAIAAEKAGIIKRGRPCIVGPQIRRSARRHRVRRADRIGAPVLVFGQDFCAHEEHGRHGLSGYRTACSICRCPSLSAGTRSATPRVAIAALRRAGGAGAATRPSNGA